jgi:hypothetical protein
MDPATASLLGEMGHGCRCNRWREFGYWQGNSFDWDRLHSATGHGGIINDVVYGNGLLSECSRAGFRGSFS